MLLLALMEMMPEEVMQAGHIYTYHLRRQLNHG